MINTGANGVATLTSWKLGTTAGTNTVTAAATVPNGSPVTFTATGTAGAANTIASNSSTSQSAAVGTAVAAPPSVKVTDSFGNARSGVSVTFTVTAGGGSLNPPSPATLTTGSNGVATLTSWTLGSSAGANTVQATAAVPNGSPVTFTATGTALAAHTIAANSTTSQSATVGTAVSAPPSVLVTDINGNPVQGVAVAFAVSAGGGATSPASPALINTGVNGVATLASWTLGSSAGSNTVTASASVSTGSPVTFNATGTAAAANTILANSATSQSAAVGSAGTDSSLGQGDGRSGESQIRRFGDVHGDRRRGDHQSDQPGDAHDRREWPGNLTSWTLGPTAGTNNNTLTATASVPNGSPVTFTASGTALRPTRWSPTRS